MDDDIDNEYDDEYEDEFDDDDEPTVACPYCKRQIHEDSQRCPYCEHYISQEDAPAAPKPWWIIAGVIICLVLLLIWIIGRPR
jgi:hypothetical protein